jgi:hypothetical protein
VSALGRRARAVTERVYYDEEFAEHVRSLGRDALRAGPGTPAMAEYLELFATTPGELAAMATGDTGACTCDSATWLTLSTIATPVTHCCQGTGATTTTGGVDLGYVDSLSP